MKLFFLISYVLLASVHADGGMRGYAAPGEGIGGNGTAGGHGGPFGSPFGGPSGAMPPEPDYDITDLCQGDNRITCDLRVPGPEHEVIADGGIRICRAIEDTTALSICVNSTGTIMGFDTDTCGCCGGICPDPCTTCPCTEEDTDGEIFFGGYEMELLVLDMSGSGERTITKCVPADFAVDAQLRGATCVTTCS